jgi:hypothetical protein
LLSFFLFFCLFIYSLVVSVCHETGAKLTLAEVKRWKTDDVMEWAKKLRDESEDAFLNEEDLAKLRAARLTGTTLLGYTDTQEICGTIRLPAGPAKALATAIKQLRVQIGLDAGTCTLGRSKVPLTRLLTSSFYPAPSSSRAGH